LGDYVIFVDPPLADKPAAMAWKEEEKQIVKAALSDTINNKFGGSTGFGSLDAALAEFGVSVNNPIKLERESVYSSRNPYAVASARRPYITVYDYWFDVGSPVQETSLCHEVAHFWDQAHNDVLSTEMKSWINWGDTASDWGSYDSQEDLAEAVRVYFWPQYDEGRLWTDDEMITNDGMIVQGIVADGTREGGTFKQYDWLTGSDQLMLDENGVPSKTGTIQVQDRYDWLQMKFTGKWK
jgi:hypothetical protein